jgi:type II secretion system protein I
MMSRHRYPAFLWAAGPAAGAPGGFTLLEVLVALAIFVGSAAMLSRLLLLGIENAEYADWQAIAWSVAESHSAELDAGVLTIDDAGTYVDENFPDWQWTLEADATSIEGLYQVTIVVENISNGASRGFTLHMTRLYFDEAAISSETSSST